MFGGYLMSFFDMETRLLGEFENNKDVWVEYVENGKKNGHSKKYVGITN